MAAERNAVMLNRLTQGLRQPAAALRFWLRMARPYLPLARPVDPAWRLRADLAVAAPDNADIPRCDRAGRRQGCWLTMHNGVQILAHGYYGVGMAHLLRTNRGVHEPQEERVFQEVLKHLPAGATMLELGAYWGFYSLWFLDRIAGGRAVLVEPNAENLRVGRCNFRRNRRRGIFLQYRIGAAAAPAVDGVPAISPDGLADALSLDRIDLLHADIQGAEVEMLTGCTRLMDERRVGYLFISTHSPDLHTACLDRLRTRDFIILADVDPRDSYSVDGLIAARAPWYPGVGPVSVSRRRRGGGA